MRIVCPVLGIAALLLALPPTVPPATASSAPPYHLAAETGHDWLQRPGWRRHDDRGRRRPWEARARWRGPSWSAAVLGRVRPW